MASTNAHSSWISTLDIVQSSVRTATRTKLRKLDLMPCEMFRAVLCRGVVCPAHSKTGSPCLILHTILPNTTHGGTMVVLQKLCIRAAPPLAPLTVNTVLFDAYMRKWTSAVLLGGCGCGCGCCRSVHCDRTD